MEIINDRRALHQIPELELRLPKTAAYLKRVLQPLRCTLTEPKGDAVCAFFDFGKDDAIAFRADMDALPIPEETGLPFASQHRASCMPAAMTVTWQRCWSWPAGSAKRRI